MPIPEAVLPVVVAPEAIVQYGAWRAARGLPPDEPVCRSVWPDVVVVCGRVDEAAHRRWISAGDLAAWGVDATGFWSTLEQRTAARVAAHDRVQAVTGAPDFVYWAEAEGDGWAAAPLLAPEAVAKRLGATSLRVAAPSSDVVLAWIDRGPELDQIVAVGVAELAAARDGLTPEVWLWREGWAPAFVARPRPVP